MIVHEVRVHPSAARLPREAQLTWKLAELAAAAPPPEAEWPLWWRAGSWITRGWLWRRSIASRSPRRVSWRWPTRGPRERRSSDCCGHPGAGRVGVLGQCHGRARAGLP